MTNLRKLEGMETFVGGSGRRNVRHISGSAVVVGEAQVR